MVNKYPNYKIVNFDKARRERASVPGFSPPSPRSQLDYCSSLKNLDSIRGRPNYSFVKVCIAVPPSPPLPLRLHAH